MNHTPAAIIDRVVTFWHEFVVGGEHAPQQTNILIDHLSGNCTVKLGQEYLRATCLGVMGSYQLRYLLPNRLVLSGIGLCLRLSGWKRIRYLGVGYTHEGVYRHVKIVNPRRDQWFEFSIGHGDIAFGLQNDWDYPPPTEIGDIRLYISGEPSTEGGTIDVSRMWCWNEPTSDDTLPAGYALPIWHPGSTEWAQGRPDILEIIDRYLRKCFRSSDEQATAFMRDGLCPLYGERSLHWPVGMALPPDLEKVGTYRFSWHGLHPAMILILHARSTRDDAPLYAARELVTLWLERSYFRNDTDKKFAWYDHGTAERLLAMVMQWAIGVEKRYDKRFMSRLRAAIFRHGQLLDSEVFYASHQPTRYHNHAWFQDIALMATALAIPDFPCSERWLRNALDRLTDQLDTLIVRDEGFAVFVENSIGYHQGVQRLVQYAGELITAAGLATAIPEISVELFDFSDFLRYPDNRTPAQGDTFRRANARGDQIRRSKAYKKPSCIILPKAGYGIVKGNHDGIPFMFSLFATSLCRTHKHEDNLSFTLFFDGIEWLIDPSFYSHEYASPIPAYLRSAVAHNALVIPGMKYSIEPGLASIWGEIHGDEFEMQGVHRAYSDIVIKRHVRGFLGLLSLAFTDSSERAQILKTQDMDCRPSLMLHCGEQVDVELNGKVLMLSHPDSKYKLRIELPGDDVVVHYGILKNNIVRGLSGLGFMQQASINTIECRVPFGQVPTITRGCRRCRPLRSRCRGPFGQVLRTTLDVIS